jgi:general L-amino acid transport system permease protein
MSTDPAPIRPNAGSSLLPVFLRDARVLKIIGQVIFAIVLIAAVSGIWTSILSSLQSKNLTPNTAFLSNRAGFDISEHPDWYSSNNTYGDAFRVGLENSLRIIGIGLVLTTIFGILMGIFLLSSNWLVRTISYIVVEILRNTPLLVQLIAWYFVVMLSLPLFQEAASLPQEGIMPIAVRLLIYIVALVMVWALTLREPLGSPRRVLMRNGLLAAILVIEVAFHWFAPGVYASARLDNVTFLVYLIISLALIAASWLYAPPIMRWRVLGLSIGQFAGGILFYFGLIPSSWFAKITVVPAVLLSKRGLVLPEILPTARFDGWLVFVIIGIILASAVWVYWGRRTERTGQPNRRGIYSPLIVLAFALVGWGIVSLPAQPATISVTQKDGTTVDMTIADASAAGLLTEADQQTYSQSPILYIPPVQKISPAGIVSGLVSGSQITPEYMALLLGLVVYTAAFIAEIVRAGILAVPHGQIEAARALGLSTNQTLRMVILPQALRVIIPPLGNQYLNLSKNSSLAVAVAYADLVLVTTTIMNQSGQSVTGITMIMVTYLALSLIIAAAINLVNRRFQIVTR